jgi:Zn-dependent protease with chaperone function
MVSTLLTFYIKHHLVWTVDTGFIVWIINASLYVLLFLAFLIVASISYYEYTRSPGRRWSLLFALYAVPVPDIIAVLFPVIIITVILIIFIIILIVFGLYPLPSILSFAVVFYILSRVYMMRVRGEAYCSKEGLAPVNDLDFVVCYEGPVNAWYNYRKNKIYISDKLLGRLNDEELRAIYYHEEGHKKYRHLVLLSESITGVWLIFFPLAFTVFVLTTFKIVNITFWDYVLLISYYSFRSCKSLSYKHSMELGQ